MPRFLPAISVATRAQASYRPPSESGDQGSVTLTRPSPSGSRRSVTRPTKTPNQRSVTRDDVGVQRSSGPPQRRTLHAELHPEAKLAVEQMGAVGHVVVAGEQRTEPLQLHGRPDAALAVGLDEPPAADEPASVVTKQSLRSGASLVAA